VRLFKNRLASLSVSLALLLVAFPLISIGATNGSSALWWFGLGALAAGGLIPPARRLVIPKEP
jgi:hypothetical protein